MPARPDTGTDQRWWWSSAVSHQVLQVLQLLLPNSIPEVTWKYKHTANTGGPHTSQTTASPTQTHTRALLWPIGNMCPPGRALCSAAASMSSSNALGFLMCARCSCCLAITSPLRALRPGLVSSWRPSEDPAPCWCAWSRLTSVPFSSPLSVFRP